MQALDTRSEKIEKLLDEYLPKRPSQAVVLFARVLIETGQTHQLDNIGIEKADITFIKEFPGKKLTLFQISVTKRYAGLNSKAWMEWCMHTAESSSIHRIVVVVFSTSVHFGD